jgi:hypothetical protein
LKVEQNRRIQSKKNRTKMKNRTDRKETLEQEKKKIVKEQKIK